MEPSQKQAKRLARLDASRKRHGITLQAIADEASKTSRRGSVSVPTVSKVLSGDTKSANVIDTLKRLIAAARAGRSLQAALAAHADNTPAPIGT